MPPVLSVFLTFFKLGLTAFGGPVAHIGYLQRELVENKRWVDEHQFGQLLAISQMLPGPASSQLGFALGLLRAGFPGALAAFIGFTLPAVVALLVITGLLDRLPADISTPITQGLKLVACAIVADALISMYGKLCPDTVRRSIALIVAAGLVAAASATLQLLAILLGAVAGLLFLRNLPATDQKSLRVPYSPNTGWLLLAVFALLLLILPMLAGQSPLTMIAAAFYQSGALVFGGGHVVLPLLEQATVASGQISQQDFLAGYGAAQAIPGPLFTLAAYLGLLIPTGEAAWTGSVLALLMIFLPGFLLIAGVLPLWHRLTVYAQAHRAIAGINAAVVGLLGAALYDPVITAGINATTDLVIVLIGYMLIGVWKLSPLYVVAWCTSTSLAVTLL